MKHKLLSVALLLSATLCVFSSVAEERLHELIIDSEEDLVDSPENWVYNKSARYIGHIVTTDIIQVEFDMNHQQMIVYTTHGGSAYYDLSKIKGLSFSFLEENKLPSPIIGCYPWSYQGSSIPANSVNVKWNAIEGASGYEIAYSLDDGRFYTPLSAWVSDPSTTHIVLNDTQPWPSSLIHNLEYSSRYRFAVKALSPHGEAFDSEWSVRTNLKSNPDDNCAQFTTQRRGNIPNIYSVAGTTPYSVTVDILPVVPDSELYDGKLQSNDGRYVFDKILLVNTVNGKENVRYVDVSEDDIATGSITINDLEPDTYYYINLYNSSLPQCDALYNLSQFLTKAEYTDGPYLIKHIVANSEEAKNYLAAPLDDVLSYYVSNHDIPEGQIFYLEGGKNYFLNSNFELTKGFTLCTDPADLASGKEKAKVYMGGMSIDYNTGGCKAHNWLFGGTKPVGDFGATKYYDKVIFKDIDFDCPKAINFGISDETGLQTTGNYFINSLSSGVPFEYESVEIHNCTFQNFTRGFIRVQGSSNYTINHLMIDNCVFMNCGYYNGNNGGYSFIEGAGYNDNIFKDLQITNNTFYDVQWNGLMRPIGTRTPTFSDDTHWNILVENNTFINYGSRGNKPLFYMRNVPGDSKIAIKHNLFSMARDADDQRNLYFYGFDIRTVQGSGIIEFDIVDNYSTGCLDSHLTDDGIFNPSTSKFSATKNTPGMWPDLLGNNTVDDLKVKVGSTPIYTTDLFADPNPRYHAREATENNPTMHSIDPEEIWTRLKYNDNASVKNHEIYTKGIGAPRWRSADPKSFRIDPAND